MDSQNTMVVTEGKHWDERREGDCSHGGKMRSFTGSEGQCCAACIFQVMREMWLGSASAMHSHGSPAVTSGLGRLHQQLFVDQPWMS